MDLKNGFHHIRMNELSIPYNFFVTPLGQFEYLRIPFELTNAPKVFARLMKYIFNDLIRDGEVTLYLDDILIATKSISEHLDILGKVWVWPHNLI